MNILIKIFAVILGNMLGFLTSAGVVTFGRIKNGFTRTICDIAIIGLLFCVSLLFQDNMMWFGVTALISLLASMFSITVCSV